MSEKVYTFVVQDADLLIAGKASRVDVFLAAQKTLSRSRSQIRKLIVDGEITVNGTPVKPGYQVNAADEIVVRLPEPRPLDIVAEEISLDIVYEDEHLIVLNKAAGMVVHPAPGHQQGTLVHALLHHCQSLSGIGGVQRPGIVHRLDRDTSGLMLVAKTDVAHHHLSAQLKSRELTRLYQTIVHGRFNQLSGSIEAPIGRHHKNRKKMAVDPRRGRYALSHYRVVRQYPAHTFVEVQLKTGRTHQIRVHFKHISHPVLGDSVYGATSKNNLGLARQALHARSITFIHPVTLKRMELECALPDDIQQILDKLERMSRGRA